MKITAKMREAGKWTFYDVMLATSEGKEPFLTIKDCKMIEGSKGTFVGFPSRKDAQDKWWPMVYGSDEFQAAIITAMRSVEPDKRTIAERRPKPPVAEDFSPPF